MPYEQDDNRADGSADQSRTLIGTIPPNGLTNERGEERPDDTKHRREDEAGGIVGTGSEQTCDNPRSKTDNDGSPPRFRSNDDRVASAAP